MAPKGLQNAMKAQFKCGYQKGHTDGVQFATEKYSTVLLVCLKDKFDFTPEQLQAVVIHINDQFDSVDQGYLSFDDMIHAIEDETGIVVKHNGVAVLEEGDSSE